MITEKKKKTVGIILSAIGGILGVVGHSLLFIMYYEPYQAAMLVPPPSGVGTDAIIVAFLPIIADFGIISGILYLLCSMGFYYETKWALPTAYIANIFALLAGFWPFIPAITVSQPPVYFPIIFLPNLLLFFGLLLYVGDTSWKQTLLALTVGIAFVMSFMNGVASTNRILGVNAGRVTGNLEIAAPIYVLSQRINWIAAFGYAAVTFGIILLNEKEWVRFIGIGSALLCLLGGMPLAILNTIDKSGELSMFFFAPVLSIPLLLIFLWPSLWERLVNSRTY
jgi:hypothetical protein